MNDYVSIGRFVGTFGLHGDVIIKHVLGAKSELKKIEVFFIEENKNSFIPYFIKNAKAKANDEITVKIEGIDTKEAASALLKKKFG